MNEKLIAAFLAANLVASTSSGSSAELIEPLEPYVDGVVKSLGTLTVDRTEKLEGVVDYLVSKAQAGDEAELVFICTHNSRRSHLAQVWCQVAAAHFDRTGIRCYSGGTEATACNVRTVRALRRSGLSVAGRTSGANPHYWIQYSETLPPILAFSKVYSDDINPQSGFAAMMCCSDADERCPVVAGADVRFPLHYEDPKIADDMPQETARYDASCFEIAQEMFYVMSELSRRMK